MYCANRLSSLRGNLQSLDFAAPKPIALTAAICLPMRNGVACCMFCMLAWMMIFSSFLCRVGDTYPNQMLQVQVRAYFYRWKPHISLEGEEWPFTAWELKITDGLMSANQLLLRMPTTMVHVIDDDSPLAAWRTGRAAVATDSDSEIVVVVTCCIFHS